MQNILELLEGFVDMHIHAGPSLMAREVDAWDMAREAVKGKFAAIVIKDHHIPTIGATRIIQDHLENTNLRVFGSLALNNSVGGLNPRAAEAAIGFGAKVVWMPTVSSRNHIEMHRVYARKYPFPAVEKKLIIPEEPIVCIDSNGNLTPDAENVLQVIAKYPDVVLATGHGNRAEINAIVRRAVSIGIKRIMVDHPHFMVEATFEDIKTWRSLGAYIEFTAVISVPASKFYCLPASEISGLIKTLGPEGFIFSSDYGQLGNGSPVDGMCAFLELLLAEGVETKSIIQILRENPSKLMGL
jgi:hypothetical protein